MIEKKQNFRKPQRQALNIPVVNVSLPSRETIKKIIELTSHDYNGDVWGDDTVLGTMDELIDAALEILRNER